MQGLSIIQRIRLAEMWRKEVYTADIWRAVSRAFEQFAVCAYAHFLNYGLRLTEREESGLYIP